MEWFWWITAILLMVEGSSTLIIRREKDKIDCTVLYTLEALPSERVQLDILLEEIPCARLHSNITDILYTFKASDELEDMWINGSVLRVPKGLCKDCRYISTRDLLLIIFGVLGGLLSIAIVVVLIICCGANCLACSVPDRNFEEVGDPEIPLDNLTIGHGEDLIDSEVTDVRV